MIPPVFSFMPMFIQFKLLKVDFKPILNKTYLDSYCMQIKGTICQANEKKNKETRISIYSLNVVYLNCIKKKNTKGNYRPCRP